MAQASYRGGALPGMAAIARICGKMATERNGPELVCVGEIARDPAWHLPAHLHPFHELIVIMGGRMRLKTQAGAVTAGAGEMFFYHAGLLHEETSDPKDPVQTRFLSFRAKTGAPYPMQMRDVDGRVGQVISWLVADAQAGRTMAESHHHLQSILGELDRLQSEPADPWLVKVRNHLWRHFREELTLDELARSAGMSRFAFARKFKALSGATPMQELRETRLNEARRLLLSTSLPLKAIAPAVGIGDEYQLSKMFRAHFGIPPREMRARREFK